MERLVPDLFQKIERCLSDVSFSALVCTCSAIHKVALSFNWRPSDHPLERPVVGGDGDMPHPTALEIRHLRAGIVEFVSPERMAKINNFVLFEIGAYKAIQYMVEREGRPLADGSTRSHHDPADRLYGYSEGRELTGWIQLSQDNPTFFYWLLFGVIEKKYMHYYIDPGTYGKSIISDAIRKAFIGEEICQELVNRVHWDVKWYSLIQKEWIDRKVFQNVLIDDFDTAVRNGRLDTVKWMLQLPVSIFSFVDVPAYFAANMPRNLTFHKGRPSHTNLAPMLRYVFDNKHCIFDIEDVLTLCLASDIAHVGEELAVLQDAIENGAYRGYNDRCRYDLTEDVLSHVTLYNYKRLEEILVKLLDTKEDYDYVMETVNIQIYNRLLRDRCKVEIIEYIVGAERELPFPRWPDTLFKYGKPDSTVDKFFLRLYELYPRDWYEFLEDGGFRFSAFNPAREWARLLQRVRLHDPRFDRLTAEAQMMRRRRMVEEIQSFSLYFPQSDDNDK